MAVDDALEGGYEVRPLTACPHIGSDVWAFVGSAAGTDLARAVVEAAKANRCVRCDSDSENWVCLACGRAFCGRYRNGHMKQHSGESGHRVCISLADLSVWCHGCDNYLDMLRIAELRPPFALLHRCARASICACMCTCGACPGVLPRDTDRTQKPCHIRCPSLSSCIHGVLCVSERRYGTHQCVLAIAFSWCATTACTARIDRVVAICCCDDRSVIARRVKFGEDPAFPTGMSGGGPVTLQMGAPQEEKTDGAEQPMSP